MSRSLAVNRCRWSVGLLLVLSLLHGRLASAHSLSIPRWGLNGGLSTGLFVAKDVIAPSLALDLTGSYSLLWLSGGLRTAYVKKTGYFMPYVEAGVWMIATVGVGYTAGFLTGSGPLIPRHNIHLYLGVPIPLVELQVISSKHVLVLTPYYRPSWGSGGGSQGFAHELGLMFKLAWFP